MDIQSYIQIFWDGYRSYANYLWYEITHPHAKNYFYWLIAVSLFFFALEVVKPWRKGQPKFRKDFWLDCFYMFFNFFLFSLIIFNAASDVVVNFFNDLILGTTNFDLQASNPLRMAPMWVVLLIGFVVRDFTQWWIHRLLHSNSFLWEFHKVHHSVQQMGFAAHLRYHWMENVVYRSLEYIPLALLGIGLYDFFIIHIFTLSVGHYNHSNVSISSRWTGGILAGFIALICILGVFDVTFLVDQPILVKGVFFFAMILFGVSILSKGMKIVFNSPEMHIWHHAKNLPENRRLGVNFGLTLALWDFVFGTNYIPHNGRDIDLGFPGVDTFPKHFLQQNVHGTGIKLTSRK